MARCVGCICTQMLLKVHYPPAANLTLGHFKFIPNGLPGLETRLPLLFTGVLQGRLTPQRFVELTSTNPAKLYGCYPAKGALLPGLSDADLVIWYPENKGAKTITNGDLHHDVDYTPYEGMKVENWPRYTVLRGEVIYEEGKVLGKKGAGEFLKRGKSSLSSPGNKFLSDLRFD
jgi:dihydropyrimidinase